MLPLIILAGPTTSKKSDTAIALAEKLDGEIISADSMQIYKYFDIGTAKVSTKDRVRIPHHLVDILEPDEEFTAFDFKIRALKHIRELIERSKMPIITGGTGLYLKVLCEGYDCAIQINSEIKEQVQFEIHNKGLANMHEELQKIDPGSAKRILPLDMQRIERALSVYRQTGKTLSEFIQTNPGPKYEFPIQTFLIKRNRKELYADINRRVDQMMQRGWVDEVKSILARKYSKSLKPFQSIGYSQIIDFIDGKHSSIEQTIEFIKKDTRHYAKRQITWFKKVRGSKTINFDPMDNATSLRDKILTLLPQTVTIFLLTLSLTLGTQLIATAKDLTSYSNAFSKFSKGNYHQTELMLRSIHSLAPNSTDGKRSLYLLAHSLMHINKPNEAISVFQLAIKSYPEMEDYIRYHLAKLLLEQGENTKVLKQINVLKEKFPKTLLYAEIQILLAKTLEKNGKAKEAMNVLSETEKRLSDFSKTTRSRSYLPEIIFYQGRLYQQVGENNLAYNRYRLLHIIYPTNQLTQQAKKEMNNLAKQSDIVIKPLTVDEHAQRLRELLYSVQYQQVVIEITELLKNRSPLPGKFYFYLARAQQGLRKRNLANTALRKFLKHYPQHNRVQEALFKIARNLWNTGRYHDGLKYFEKSIENEPGSSLANQARFFIGKMYEEKKRYPQAIKRYRTLVRKFELDEFAERAAWQLGWLNYTKGDFQKAFDYFMDSARRYPSGLFIESSMFWKAKSAEKLGRGELAQQIYDDVNNRFPYTYYGIHAGKKGTDKKQTSNENDNRTISLKEPNLSTQARFHYSRGVELSATGFYEDAGYEIKKLEDTVRKNLSGVLWLTTLYNNARAYPDTVRIMQLYKNFKTKIGEKELTNSFWKNFYPLAYAETIHDTAKNYGIDPYFVKGLIRQESLFDAQVRSRAGAIGLMQIMPKTGRVLYANAKMDGPFSTNILFDPETNIRLGTQYISELNKRFNKNPTHILISYNAGPHVLKKWLKRFSHLDDPDVFIESIPYPETRKYVKKVLRNHGIYRTLYPKKQPPINKTE